MLANCNGLLLSLLFMNAQPDTNAFLDINAPDQAQGEDGEGLSSK